MYYLKISDLPSCDGIQKKLRFDHKITINRAGLCGSAFQQLEIWVRFSYRDSAIVGRLGDTYPERYRGVDERR